MSVRVVYQDLLLSTEQAIVITVNCVGVMGKGVALDFKKRWPHLFLEYAKRCRGSRIMPGKITRQEVYKLPDGRYAIMFPTKYSWRMSSELKWIESGLKDLAGLCNMLGLDSIAIPPPGCGNGGLDFDLEVLPLIRKTFELEEIEVVVCR